MAAAHDLIVTMRAADYFKAIMPAIMHGLKPAIVQNRPEVERDYRCGHAAAARKHERPRQ